MYGSIKWIDVCISESQNWIFLKGGGGILEYWIQERFSLQWNWNLENQMSDWSDNNDGMKSKMN